MKPDEFISQVDESRIVAAIGEAEKKSTGELRVYISPKERHDALAFAKKRFQELGMFKTKQRNAVLIYIVPRTQQFAVLGDTGIHQKCGDEFWNDIVAGMRPLMKESRFTEALVQAVREIGAVLEKHFPATGENRDELSNEIARD